MPPTSPCCTSRPSASCSVPTSSPSTRCPARTRWPTARPWRSTSTRVKAVEALDFDIAALGHSPVGKKADIVAHRQYYENIAARVAAGIKAGKTLEQLQAEKIMDEYKDWVEYDEDNDINIANVYKTLSARTLM